MGKPAQGPETHNAPEAPWGPVDVPTDPLPATPMGPLLGLSSLMERQRIDEHTDVKFTHLNLLVV